MCPRRPAGGCTHALLLHALLLRALQIVLDAVDKPRQINFKGAIDLVTNTDLASEEAVLKVQCGRPGGAGCKDAWWRAGWG